MAHKSFDKLAKAASTLTESEAIPGVFFKDFSFEKLQELDALASTDEITEETDPDQMSHVLWFFDNMIVDADGDRFEDMTTAKDCQQIGVMRLNQLLKEINDYIRPSGNE